MKNLLITVRFVENLKFLQEIVSKENIIFCGDNGYNEFFFVAYSDEIYGVAYHNYGIKAQISLNTKNNLLYIGASQNFICIDINKSKILFNDELVFLFFEMLADDSGEYIYVVCECCVICYREREVVWKIDFEDIVCNYRIIKNKLFVKCVDETEYLIDLFSGDAVLNLQ